MNVKKFIEQEPDFLGLLFFYNKKSIFMHNSFLSN